MAGLQDDEYDSLCNVRAVIILCDICDNEELKGLRPLPPTPADSRIFGFLDFSEHVDFWGFSGGIWGLGGFAIDWKWLWASNGRILSPFRPI